MSARFGLARWVVRIAVGHTWRLLLWRWRGTELGDHPNRRRLALVIARRLVAESVGLDRSIWPLT